MSQYTSPIDDDAVREMWNDAHSSHTPTPPPDVDTAPSFDDWLEKVDQEVYALVGCSVHDLCDFPSRDLYDAGESPEDAAREAIEQEPSR